jgi:hypothetical protein
MIQKTLLIILLLLGGSSIICAQTGSIKQPSKVMGEVTTYDDGGLISIAKIIIESGDFRREIKTDCEGKYEIELPVGIYKVTAEAEDFRKFRRKKVTIDGKSHFILNITLKFAK